MEPDLTEVIVGTVGRAHGLRGEVAIVVRTDEPERRFAPGTRLRAEAADRSFTVASSRWHSGRLLVAFVEAEDRTAAEQLRGTVLVIDVPVDERPRDAEEFYDRQLVGMEVRTSAGEVAGQVLSLIHLEAQDLLVIETPGGERLVPFVKALVPDVDLAGRFLVVADLPGLLVDDADEDAGAE